MYGQASVEQENEGIEDIFQVKCLIFTWWDVAQEVVVGKELLMSRLGIKASLQAQKLC